MNAIVKSLTRGLGKQTLRDAVKAGGWKVIIDGSLAYVEDAGRMAGPLGGGDAGIWTTV